MSTNAPQTRLDHFAPTSRLRRPRLAATALFLALLSLAMAVILQRTRAAPTPA